MLNPPKIDSYQFGLIVIDGRKYKHDVIIRTDGVLPNWWRAEGHSLSMDDLKTALEVQPRVLIIGTGANGRMQVPAETMHKLEESGVDVIVNPTAQACEIYNEIRAEGGVVAGLHLTC